MVSVSEDPGCMTPVAVVARPLLLASVVHGVGHSLASVHKLGVPALGLELLLPFCELPYELAVGVGQDEQPLAAVGRADLIRAETIPARIVPAGGKILQDPIEPTSKEARDVLEDDDAGPELADDAGEFPPQSGTLPGLESNPRSSCADVLAREPPADDVDSVVFGGDPHVVHVSPAVDPRPPLVEDFSAVGGSLALPDASGSEDVLDGEVEPADAGERGAIPGQRLPWASGSSSPGSQKASASISGGGFFHTSSLSHI